ncbi:MAG: glycine zipper family protein [Acidimicrobiia bacterium]|nr:glycine zipper family protein [Acidimicrobiia bacterium]
MDAEPGAVVSLATTPRLLPAIPSAAGQVVLVAAVCATVGAAAMGRRGAALAASVATVAMAPYGASVARHRPYTATPAGAWRWFVDSTWSAPNTLAGAVFHHHQWLRGNRGVPARSTGSGTLWLEQPAIAGYATTVGIVKAGSNDRVDAHEDVHVLQARLLGPLYLPLVAAHYAVATVFPYWLLRRSGQRPPMRTVRDYLHEGVYHEVWHERWAYAVAPTTSRGAGPA